MVSLNLTGGIPYLSPAWHKFHRNNLTSTDIAGLLDGVDTNWKAPYAIWARVTGKLPEDEFEGNAFTEWGNRTEPLNRAWLSDLIGQPISDTPGLLVHPELSYFGSTPDAVVGLSYNQDWFINANHNAAVDFLDIESGLELWEGKAPSVHTVKDWADGEVPLKYVAQVQGAMMVTGVESAVISALIPPRKADDSCVPYARITADPELHAAIRETLEDFWEKNVKWDLPPNATGKEIDTRAIRAVLGKDAGTVMEFGDANAALALEREQLAAQIRDLGKRKDELTNQLKVAIGDHAYAQLPDGRFVKCREQVSQMKAQPAHEKRSRPLTIVKALPKGFEVPA